MGRRSAGSSSDLGVERCAGQPTAMSVISLANALKVHPAIVAGKIRHEQKNYRLLSHFVGTGAVRHHLGGGQRHASSRRSDRKTQ